MPYTSNPKLFDVMLHVGFSSLFLHIDSRTTAAGAIGPAMGTLKGKERNRLTGLRVQECEGGDECWGKGLQP